MTLPFEKGAPLSPLSPDDVTDVLDMRWGMGWGVLMVLFGRRGVSYSFKECFRATLTFIRLGVTTVKSFLTTNKKNPPQNHFSIGISVVSLSI